MLEIVTAKDFQDYKLIEKLAGEIFPEVYNSIIPSDHVLYFIDKFQSTKVINKQITEENYKYYLLNYNNETVGYFGIQFLNNKVILSKIYILNLFRGKGLGKKALDFIDNIVITSKISKIELIVNKDNLKTIEIYKKNGYAIVKPVINSFENGHSVENIIMEKVFNF